MEARIAFPSRRAHSADLKSTSRPCTAKFSRPTISDRIDLSSRVRRSRSPRSLRSLPTEACSASMPFIEAHRDNRISSSIRRPARASLGSSLTTRSKGYVGRLSTSSGGAMRPAALARLDVDLSCSLNSSFRPPGSSRDLSNGVSHGRTATTISATVVPSILSSGQAM